MVLGIISIVIGAIIFIASLVNDITTVQQQTVQHLDFIWGSLFFVGGLIMMQIEKCKIKTTVDNDTKARKDSEESALASNNYIVTSEKALRREPSITADVILHLKAETKIKVISKHKTNGYEWVFVETQNGDKGYCLPDYMQEIK